MTQPSEIVKALNYFKSDINLISFFGTCILFIAKIYLIFHILRRKNCSGISGRSQILYTLVFVARCFDILWIGSDMPILISVFKSFWISLLYTMLLLIYHVHKDSYDREYDKFPIKFLIVPCFLLSLHDYFDNSKKRIFWSLSIYLETLASLPQYYHVWMDGQMKSCIHYYLIMTSVGKFFDVVAEMYNYQVRFLHFDGLILTCGLIQLLLYYTFFDYYSRKTNKKIVDEAEETLSPILVTTNVQNSTPSALGISNITRPTARPNEYI